MKAVWNRNKSISLSKLCILLFMVLLIVTVVFAPGLTRWYFNFPRPLFTEAKEYFLATIYVGAVPAAYLLYNLLGLLRRIQAGQVFIPDNVETLRRISWSCFIGAGIALVSVIYYIPWLFMAVSAAFMGLIVRVVKNVVAQAVSLQDEVDSII